VSTAIKLKY